LKQLLTVSFGTLTFSTESDASANDSEERKKLAISANRLPAILLHGFGASLFSWERVLKPLASVIGSKTLAFDRPAFGLTSRPQRRGLFLVLFTWVSEVVLALWLFWTLLTYATEYKTEMHIDGESD
jgi:pimeloyl-ACP methyl ester carboxylesterase